MNKKDRNLPSIVLKNTTYNIIGNAWGVSVVLFLTPYIVHHIGAERFGIWALVGIISGYFGLLDFGVGQSFVKYIAEFYTKNEYSKISQLVSMGTVLYFVFTVIVTWFASLFIIPIVSIFKIPHNLYGEAIPVFLIGIALFGLSNAFSAFAALQTGLQRMDISNKVSMAMSVPNIAGVILCMEKGYGLTGLMVNNAIIFIVTTIVHIVIAFKLFPELRFDPFSFNKDVLFKMFGFGYKMQIAKISGFVATQTDKILICCFLSVGLVTVYQLGYAIVSYAMIIPGLMVSALMPAFSEIDARGERGRLISAYLQSTKYVTFIAVPIFIFLIVSASQIMDLWMGPGYEKSAFVMQILAIGWMINAIAQVGASASMAIEKPELMAKSAVITISLNIFLNVILIKSLGFLGAAWGTMLAVNIGTLYFFFELHKKIDVPIRELAKTIIPYCGACFAGCCAVLCADLVARICNMGGNWPVRWALFSARFIVFFGMYVIMINYFKLLGRSDIDFLQEHFPAARRVFGILFSGIRRR